MRLSSRDVERLSYELALQRNNKQYYVSHSWVTDIERGKFRPSVLKLRTLSVIYHGNYDEYLALFDFPLSDIVKEHSKVQREGVQVAGVPLEMKASLSHTVKVAAG